MTDIIERLHNASLQTDYGLDIDKELMDEGWREIERLRAQRTEFDCRYTMGNVADVSGSHCPSDEPCMRCQNERLRRHIDTLEGILGEMDIAAPEWTSALEQKP